MYGLELDTGKILDKTTFTNNQPIIDFQLCDGPSLQ